MKIYRICRIHNKIKMKKRWIKFQKRIGLLIGHQAQRLILKDTDAITPTFVDIPCDECDVTGTIR